MVRFALSGIVESLPTDRPRAAGVLRVAATVALSCLLAAPLFAPEFVVGR
ncbi:hypothetical protein [Salinigranum halophilum]|nr:hypothetical protein [Salinigranum halophilum]